MTRYIQLSMGAIIVALLWGCSSTPSNLVSGNKISDGTIFGSRAECLKDITGSSDSAPLLRNACATPIDIATCAEQGSLMLGWTTFCGPLKGEKELQLLPNERFRVTNRATKYLVVCGVGQVQRQPWKSSNLSSGSASCADGGKGSPLVEKSTAAADFVKATRDFSGVVKPMLEAEAARKN